KVSFGPALKSFFQRTGVLSLTLVLLLGIAGSDIRQSYAQEISTRPGIEKIVDKAAQARAEELIKQMRDPYENPFSYFDMQEQFKEIGKPAVKPLIRVLDNDNEPDELRYYAVGFLGDLNARESFEHILKVAADNKESGRVRRQAIWTLGRFKDRRASKFLLNIVEKRLEGTNEWRGIAAKALGVIGEEKAAEPLIKIAGDEKEDNELRMAAIQGLGEISDERVFNFLLNKLKTRSEFIVPYIHALGNQKNPKAIEILTDIYEDDNEEGNTRCQAIQSLSRIKDPRVVKYLIDRAAEDIVIVGLLGNHKDPRVIKPLLNFLKSENYSVRSRAADSLKNLKDMGVPGVPNKFVLSVYVFFRSAVNDYFMGIVLLVCLFVIPIQIAAAIRSVFNTVTGWFDKAVEDWNRAKVQFEPMFIALCIVSSIVLVMAVHPFVFVSLYSKTQLLSAGSSLAVMSYYLGKLWKNILFKPAYYIVKQGMIDIPYIILHKILLKLWMSGFRSIVLSFYKYKIRLLSGEIVDNADLEKLFEAGMKMYSKDYDKTGFFKIMRYLTNVRGEGEVSVLQNLKALGSLLDSKRMYAFDYGTFMMSERQHPGAFVSLYNLYEAIKKDDEGHSDMGFGMIQNLNNSSTPKEIAEFLVEEDFLLNERNKVIIDAKVDLLNRLCSSLNVSIDTLKYKVEVYKKVPRG
ncbi:HEAT repeat domain-containing protein, partial [Candidatus Auribacterota bacterium]